jgi:hypothetical protein
MIFNCFHKFSCLLYQILPDVDLLIGNFPFLFKKVLFKGPAVIYIFRHFETIPKSLKIT